VEITQNPYTNFDKMAKKDRVERINIYKLKEVFGVENHEN